MTEEISASDRMMLEGLYWWDIPTPFRCPVVCLKPTRDHPNRQTAHFASAVMFEILSLIADSSEQGAC